MISQRLKKIVSWSTVFIFLFATINVVYAQEVTTKMSGAVTQCIKNGVEVPCDSFSQLVDAVRGLLTYAVGISLAFSVVVIAYAGWLYLNAGENPGNIGKAKDMFVKVAYGVFWVLAAWLIVNLIVTALVKPDQVTNIIKN